MNQDQFYRTTIQLLRQLRIPFVDPCDSNYTGDCICGETTLLPYRFPTTIPSDAGYDGSGIFVPVVDQDGDQVGLGGWFNLENLGNGIYGGSGIIPDSTVAKFSNFTIETTDDEDINEDLWFSGIKFGASPQSDGTFSDSPSYTSLFADNGIMISGLALSPEESATYLYQISKFGGSQSYLTLSENRISAKSLNPEGIGSFQIEPYDDGMSLNFSTTSNFHESELKIFAIPDEGVALLGRNTITEQYSAVEARANGRIRIIANNENGSQGQSLISDEDGHVVWGDPRPYKVYTALLTQSGTDAPVATVLENTLGGTPVWSRISAGVYRVSLIGNNFLPDKTIILCPMVYEDGGIVRTIDITYEDDYINFESFLGYEMSDWVGANITPPSSVSQFPIEIRVYL